MDRAKLINTLRAFHSIEKLSTFTDKMLYEQWLFDCEYAGGVNHDAK